MPTYFLGKNLRLWFDYGSGYEKVEYARSTGVTIANEQIDVTTAEENWRELLPGGVRAISVNSSGVVATSNLKSAMWNGSILPFKVTYGESDTEWISGNLKFISFERSGEYNGEELFSITADSTGEISQPAGDFLLISHIDFSNASGYDESAGALTNVHNLAPEGDPYDTVTILRASPTPGTVAAPNVDNLVELPVYKPDNSTGYESYILVEGTQLEIDLRTEYCTIFAVCKAEVSEWNSTSPPRIAYYYSSTTQSGLVVTKNTVGCFTGPDEEIEIGYPQNLTVFAWRFNGDSTLDVWRNNVKIVSSLDLGGLFPLMRWIRISSGSSNSGNSPWTRLSSPTFIGEHRVYLNTDAVATDGEVESVITDLASKWGISLA